MSNQQLHQGVVVGVDGSEASIAAVQWAARDAELRNVALKIVHAVMPIVVGGQGWPGGPIPADYAQLVEEEAARVINQAQEAARTATPARAGHIIAAVVHDQPVPALVEMSRHAEMIVVGCHGEGAMAQALLGSVSSGLAHHSHCPVAVVHHHEAVPLPSPTAPVVVGIDGSPTSELATGIAFDEASRRGVDLVALHAWSDMGALGMASINWAPIEWYNIRDQEEEVLAERLAGWRERYPDVVVHREVVCDRPGCRLLEQAIKAQLVVVGSHGRGGFPGMLLGSVSSAVVNNAAIPVIIARTPRNQ